MKQFFLSLIFISGLAAPQLFAQNHFIFIQAETKKPFSVSVNNKEYKSSSSGYVIIPRLKSGQHDLMVKMMESGSTGLKFTTTIDKKDVGFTFKNLSAANAGLVNIQTFATISNSTPDSYVKVDNVSEDKIKVETPKSDVITETKSPKDKITTATKEPVSVAAKPVVKLKKGINKISETLGERNVSLVFIDVQGDNSDTIDVVIPIQIEEPVQPAINNYSNNSLFKWASNNHFYEDEGFDFQEGYNKRCVHLLTKEDYARLRKRMAAEINEDKMIAEALKFAKTKCFTTEQVKNLSILFNKEQGKYKFFDAVYSSVYDYIYYPQLEKEFTDVSYINKFKSLLQQ